MAVSRLSMLLALCSHAGSQSLIADDSYHVSLLQTHAHRRSAQDEPGALNLNAMQSQLDKLQWKVSTVSHLHDAKKERKHIMMVDLQNATNEATADETIGKKKTVAKQHHHKTKTSGRKRAIEGTPVKIDKFAKASLAKADKAKKTEKAAMESILDEEAADLEEVESHILSAGALNRLEEVAERVGKANDDDDNDDEGWEAEDKLENKPENKHDDRHDDKQEEKHEDKYGQHDEDEENDEDYIDPEAELVRLAHQRASREEAKAKLAEKAAKQAWVELEKFQAQRNLADYSTGEATPQK